MKHINRRDFAKKSLIGAGAANLFTRGFSPASAYAQAQSRSVRRADRYEDSFIFERKPFKWPGGSTLAVWIIPNVEVWHYDSPIRYSSFPECAESCP